MLRRLTAVADDPHLIQHFYPRLLASAGQKLEVIGMGTLLITESRFYAAEAAGRAPERMKTDWRGLATVPRTWSAPSLSSPAPPSLALLQSYTPAMSIADWLVLVLASGRQRWG